MKNKEMVEIIDTDNHLNSDHKRAEPGHFHLQKERDRFTAHRSSKFVFSMDDEEDLGAITESGVNIEYYNRYSCDINFNEERPKAKFNSQAYEDFWENE